MNTTEYFANREWEVGTFGPFCKLLFDGYGLPYPIKVFEPRMDMTRFAGAYTEPPATSFTAVSSFTSETNLWTNIPIWSPIPLLQMRAGAIFECRGGGVYSTAATGPTFVFTARVGTSATPSSNITLGASATITTANAVSAKPWYFQFTFQIRALGVATSTAAGTGNGIIFLGSSAAVDQVAGIGSTIASTIDNTVSNGFVLSCTCSTASASTTLTTQWLFMRQLN